MALVPYEPFRHLDNIRREFDRFFTSEIPAIRTNWGHNFANPNIDVYETGNEVVATCDIPGLEKKEDVNIDIDNNLLIISGTVNRVNELKEEHLHRQERFSGVFNVRSTCRLVFHRKALRQHIGMVSWKYACPSCNLIPEKELTLNFIKPLQVYL